MHHFTHFINHRLWHRLLILISCLCLLSACSVSTPTTTPVSASPSVTPQPSSTATRIAPSSTPQPTLWLDPHLPEALRAQIALPDGWQWSQDAAQATCQLQAGARPPATIRWSYALVAPFYTLTDDVRLSDLQQLWRGQQASQTLPVQRLLVAPDTLQLFTLEWGSPGPNVVALPAQQLLSEAEQAPNSWALLPFEQLEPRWKVLRVEGSSPIQQNFDPAADPLTRFFTFNCPNAPTPNWLPSTNRDPQRFTSLILTGVTALVRGTGIEMEQNGYTYPAEEIGDLLRSADLTHISNEIPFWPKCPNPAYQNGTALVFCSRPQYLELLQFIGTDIVELTGDHFNDWGPEAMRYTLDLYRQNQLPVYGGGENLAAAQQPLLIEHHGNRLAFLGCNAKPIGYSSATATNPGTWHCDMDWMESEVRSLREQGYLPIVTFQHLEYYDFVARPALQADFQRMAEAGAVIVSGSQAHQPHAFELRPNAFLHYGLGNLFFDQYNWPDSDTDKAFIDRHIFYNGKHISTELITIRFVDFAKSRFMTPEERADLLQKVFAVSTQFK